MSGTNPTPPAVDPEPIWAKPAVSVYALTIFLIAFGVAYMAKDSASLTMMMGAAISMGTQVVSYYLGSSSGSTQKTAMLNAAPPPTTRTTGTAPSP